MADHGRPQLAEKSSPCSGAPWPFVAPVQHPVPHKTRTTRGTLPSLELLRNSIAREPGKATGPASKVDD